MIKLRYREKILFIIVFVLIFIFLAKLFIFDSLKEKIVGVEEEIDRLSLLLRRYLELEKQRDLILKERKKIDKYLSFKGTSDEKVARVMSIIESESRRCGFSILELSPALEVSKKKTIPQIFSVQLRAEVDSLQKLFDFIYSIENSDILIRINKINLSTKDEGTRILRVDASIIGIFLS